MKNRTRACLVTALLLAAAPAAPAGENDEWHFSLTPYLWLPSLEFAGDFETPPGGDGRPDVEVGPIDFLEHLELAFMLAAEAHRGNWFVRADIVYVDFGHEDAAVKSVSGPGGSVEIPVDTGTTVTLDGLQWQATVGYLAVRTSNVSLEIFGGVRYLDVSASLDWEFDGPLDLLPQSGSSSQNLELWDGIIGTRGRVAFSNRRWFLPFHLDAGAGSSVSTWQAFAGLGYAFSWGDAIAAYRHLEYDQEEGELLRGARLSGPAIGVSLRF
jgi:hypothetical protein